MPLFGSNFAEGFATGFATETSKAINKAVDRRDEEVSKAKAFAMKRAEQLDAEAAAKDARTEKAIDKMAAKFTKGGKTDWNRVYSAMMAVDGADLDSLDALFENIQKTEASGQSFNIDDVFKYAEGDSELSKLSKDDIFQALRAEYAAPTVQTSDTGLLSKIGLGAGTTGGERATEEMQGLFPGATRTAITGDYGTTTVDQKPLAAAIEYGMKIAEYEKNMTPSLAEAYASTAAKIGKLDMNSPTYTQDLAELKKEQDRNVANIAAYTKATTEETTAKGSMTASGFAKVITDGEASALALSGINEKLGIYTDANGEVQRDGLVNPQGIASAKKRALEGYYEKHVRGQMDGNGQLSFLGQQVIMNRPELKAIYDRITGSETTTTITGAGADDTTTGVISTQDNQPNEIGKLPSNASPAEVDAKLVERYPDPEDFVKKFLPKQKNNPQALFNRIMELYPTASPQTIQDKINEQLVLLRESQKSIKAAPSFTYRTPEQIEKDEEALALSDFAGGGAQVNGRR